MPKKYKVQTTEVKSRDGCWNTLQVDIFENKEDGYEKIGGYERGYANLFNTFVPFIQRGKEYALYSINYTTTSIMRLPSCEYVCGEERNSYGFCPVDYYVPYEPDCGIHGDFGFVAGCIWGDDSSMKVELLDLRRIEEGLIIRTQPFGYHILPAGVPLKDCVNMDNYFIDLDVDGKKYSERIISIASKKDFLLNENYEIMEEK